MDAQSWVGVGAICASTIGYVIVASVRHSNKLAVVEQRNIDLERKLEDQKRDNEKLKEETERRLLEFKRDMELHENMNEKTFTKIERKLDEMNSTLMEISGYIKAKNQQTL